MNKHCLEDSFFPTHTSENVVSPPGRCLTLLVDHSSGVLVLVLRAGQDWVGQVYIQLVVVLDQGHVLVVEHQVSEGRVQIVGLGESITGGRLVDDAVLGVTLHTGEKDRHQMLIMGKYIHDSFTADILTGWRREKAHMSLITLKTQSPR